MGVPIQKTAQKYTYRDYLRYYRRPWTLRRSPGLSATSLRPGQAGRDRA